MRDVLIGTALTTQSVTAAIADGLVLSAAAREEVRRGAYLRLHWVLRPVMQPDAEETAHER